MQQQIELMNNNASKDWTQSCLFNIYEMNKLPHLPYQATKAFKQSILDFANGNVSAQEFDKLQSILHQDEKQQGQMALDGVDEVDYSQLRTKQAHVLQLSLLKWLAPFNPQGTARLEKQLKL